MQIENSDITVVMQGGIDVGWDIRYSAAFLRQTLPGVTIILATQKSALKTFEGQGAFDEVVATDDPGHLPSVKNGGGPHNINRQIMSASAGMEAVTTRYALKLRTDAYLTSRKIVDIWSYWAQQPSGDRKRGRSRILISSIFSLNPRFDERLSYHLSDWVQFGQTDDLRAFWRCPPMDFDTNTWYERNAYAPGSLYREKEFRTRFATEQWLTLNYLFDRTQFPIRHHNDTSEVIVAEFEAQLADNFIVVHPLDIDLHMPKHSYIYKSRYFNAICHSYETWKELAAARGAIAGSDVGHTQWPHSLIGKKRYVAAKQRLRWLRHMPIARSLLNRFA